MRNLVKKALTKTVVITRAKSTRAKRAARLQVVEISPSQKLLYGMYLLITLFAALTAIQIVHLIVLGSFNNEIFHLMNSLTSVMVGVFFGVKL